jgi:AraC-like DNA-binding protein
VQIERQDSGHSRWEVARREPAPELRRYLIAAPEGWSRTNGDLGRLREVPFPGIPLILGITGAWEVEGPHGRDQLDVFVAGLHAAPALVSPKDRSWSCIELRLTPSAAHRLLRWPMHELANRSVALADIVPEARQLRRRLRETRTWAERFDLVEWFLLRRLSDADGPAREVEWSWHELRRTAGGAPIRELANEVGWSHRRLIARFRDQIGLAPKAAARVMRFDRAARALRSQTEAGLGEIAYECGYFDQAHLNRDFRELAGTTPAAFRAATRPSGAVAA